jgi:hypothetical protein
MCPRYEGKPTEHLGHGGARGPDGSGEPVLGSAYLGVNAAQVLGELGG